VKKFNLVSELKIQFMIQWNSLGLLAASGGSMANKPTLWEPSLRRH